MQTVTQQSWPNNRFSQRLQAEVSELAVVVERSESVLNYFESRFVRNNCVLDPEAFEQILEASQLVARLHDRHRKSAQFLAVVDTPTSKMARLIALPRIAAGMLALGTKRSRRHLEQTFTELERRIPRKRVRLPQPKSP